jgi:hypothetical protein
MKTLYPNVAKRISLYAVLASILTSCAQSSTEMATRHSSDHGSHCDLKLPPADAVRSTWGASNVLMYPAQAGARYTGCSWFWIVYDDSTVYLAAALRFGAGELASYKSTERRLPGTSVVTECSYESGKITKRTITPPSLTSTWDCPEANQMQLLLLRPKP